MADVRPRPPAVKRPRYDRGVFCGEIKDQGENDFIVLNLSAKDQRAGIPENSIVDFTQNFDTAALKSLSAFLYTLPCMEAVAARR